jgi:hypothetical protein
MWQSEASPLSVRLVKLEGYSEVSREQLNVIEIFNDDGPEWLK